jgi:hypothetical protein
MGRAAHIFSTAKVPLLTSAMERFQIAYELVPYTHMRWLHNSGDRSHGSDGAMYKPISDENEICYGALSDCL